MTLPAHIQKAIDAGKAEHEAKKKAQAEATAKLNEELRLAEEERRRKTRAEAQQWFETDLPELIRRAAAKGENSLEISTFSRNARVDVCEEHGLKVTFRWEPDYDYETGRNDGEHEVWEVRW